MPSEKMKKLILSIWAILVWTPLCQAQQSAETLDPGRYRSQSEKSESQETDAARTVRFASKKKWEAARWYIIGKWVFPDAIKWLGTPGGLRIPFPKDCLKENLGAGEFIRGDNSDPTLKNAEILRSEDWVAIEVSPNVKEEEFLVRSGLYEQNKRCEVRIPLSYAWTRDSGKIRPLLFLSPDSNLFYGFNFKLATPVEEIDKPLDIQLELLMGYWKGSFQNAAPNANTSLHFAPTATARGEWMPFGNNWGLSLLLEQTVASFGGATDNGKPIQNALFSDWALGSFGEMVLPVADALQLRFGVQYRHHTGDDKEGARTFANVNKDAKYLVVTSNTQIYFAKRWLGGLELDYGLPSRMAGRGFDQSYLSALARLGIRTTSSMFIVLEFGWRSYRIDGLKAENFQQIQSGIRLNL